MKSSGIDCCGGKIRFSPPLLILAGEARGGVAQRYRGNRGGLGDGEYIYFGDPGVDSYHFNIQRNTHSISNIQSHSLVLSFCRTLQFMWFLTASYLTEFYHPLFILLELELLFFMHSLWKLREVRQSFDNRLSAFQPCCFTTLYLVLLILLSTA